MANSSITIVNPIWLLLAILLSAFVLATESAICFGPGLNQQGSWCADEGNLKCPWYRNLLPHVAVAEDRCPVSTLYERPAEACTGDGDCCIGSYCCFSVCEGIAKCYNPYMNEFTDPDNVKPCNGTRTTCPPPTTELTTTTTTTPEPTTEPSTPPPTTTTGEPDCEFDCPSKLNGKADVAQKQRPNGR